MSDPSHDPRTGAVRGSVPHSDDGQVDAVLAAAADAAAPLAALAPGERAGLLHALADAVDAHAPELAQLADAETALGPVRLTGEVARMASQLRFYADVCAEGSWLGVTLDPPTATASARARMNTSLGPVAVFGASNFPFAFGVLGNDTASALAAGCPVVAKAHPAHPRLSVRLGELAARALADAGAPDGSFGLVVGFAAGTRLVTDERIAAVAFTGSQHGGLALWRLANERPVVVPVFAEMGTVNPAVVTTAAAADPTGVAAGFTGSFVLGTGQFCTKPGLLLAPTGAGIPAAVADAVRDAQAHPMLTEAMAHGVGTGVQAYIDAGATVLATGTAPDAGWSAAPVALQVPAEALQPGSVFVQECFGPVALVVEYADPAQCAQLVRRLQGSLAATIVSGGPDDPQIADLAALLAGQVGRVTVDDWPTGVAWSWAQQHGGPWPATSCPAATSVGAAALDRFTRPVTFQNLPDAALPPALRADNPWRLPRRVEGRMVPA